MTFMPMVLVSFFLMLCRNKKYMMSFVFSMSCILQSHILGSLMCCVGCFFIFLSNFRKIFNISTYYILAKSFLFLVLINIWYYYPFIDYYLKVDMNMKYTSFGRVNSLFGSYAFVMIAQFFVGIPLILIVFTGIYPVINQKNKNIKIIFIIFLSLSVALSLAWTNIVPFKNFIDMPIIGYFFNILQFPFRLRAYPEIIAAIFLGYKTNKNSML